MLGEGLVIALCLILAHHLGLVEKVMEVCEKIAGCSMCSVFWGTALVLIVEGATIFEAVAIALPLAYLSAWVGILLARLDELYERIWERMGKG